MFRDGGKAMVNGDMDKKYRIPDELWKQIEPLLPPELPKPNVSGRRCRTALAHPAQCMTAFRSGEKPAYLSACGKPGF